MISKKLTSDNLDIIFFDFNKKWESYKKKKMIENSENLGNIFYIVKEWDIKSPDPNLRGSSILINQWH